MCCTRILLALDLLVIYLFILALTKSNWVALPMATAFLGVSVVPVYFVWLMPELFNVSLALYAMFFWAYKEVAGERLSTVPEPNSGRAGVGLHCCRCSSRLATFSKPPHLLLLVPMILLASAHALSMETRTPMILVICGAVTAALFALMRP